jgi:tRNA(fMet)-specific endonuclease VapC
VVEPSYLLDSNICIYLLGGLSDPALRRVQACRPGEIVTSTICYAEVMRGVDQAVLTERLKAEQLFKAIAPLEFDKAAALHHSQLPFRRNSFDGLIAAHAVSAGLVLVTNNEADFADVPGLTIENWTL